MTAPSLDRCRDLDRTDPLASLRNRFRLPKGIIYLDGNSLGALTNAVKDRLNRVVDQEWGRSLIKSWNIHGWMDLPNRVGDRIAALIGAGPGQVVVGETTSINLFNLLASAHKLSPDRTVILSDNGNFPTDLYMAQGLAGLLAGRLRLRLVDPDQVEAAIDSDTAAVMLTQVDFRTGRLHDMARINRAAQAVGALTLWDLCHSAGVVPIDLAGTGTDLAVGCTYKYLNGGPGSPAFVYVRPGLQERIQPPLTGWLGHADPFAMGLDYRPATGIRRMRVGTPMLLSLSALDAALEAWDGVDISQVRQKSISLSSLFIDLVQRDCSGHGLVLASPADPARRGSQVSFRCPEGYAVMQALIDQGVIGDYREPDLIRFGFAPLYNTHEEVFRAVGILAQVLDQGLWDRPGFRTRAKVT